MSIKLSPSVSGPQRCFSRLGQADVELPMWPETFQRSSTLEPVAVTLVDTQMQNINLLTIQYFPPLPSSLQRVRNIEL